MLTKMLFWFNFQGETFDACEIRETELLLFKVISMDADTAWFDESQYP
jgi:hypothetical protein